MGPADALHYLALVDELGAVDEGHDEAQAGGQYAVEAAEALDDAGLRLRHYYDAGRDDDDGEHDYCGCQYEGCGIHWVYGWGIRGV